LSRKKYKVNSNLTGSELKKLEDYNIDIRLKNVQRYTKLKYFAKSPIKSLKEFPEYSFFFTLPLSVTFFILASIYIWDFTYIDDIVLFSVLILLSIPAYTYHKKNNVIDDIENNISTFLRDLAELNRAGQSLPQALSKVSKNDYGELTYHITKLRRDLAWGMTFEEALKDFVDRVDTQIISRATSIIIQANRAGGRISDVLLAASKDTKNVKNMEKERKSNMFIYVVISYLSFLVFLFVVLLISSTFIPMMSEVGDVGAADTGNIQFLATFDEAIFIQLMYHASLIQGFFTGFVAGKMGEAKISEGMKHAIVLTLIAWLSFTYLI